MRILGMILSLGAIVWVLYQSAGGGDAETVVSQGHQDAIKKAGSLEQSLQADVQQKLESLDNSQD